MTGAAPAAFLDDPVMFAAYRDEAEAAAWTDIHELLAINAELTHALIRQTAAAAGAKESQLPKPLQIPRPNEKKRDPLRVSPIEVAGMIGRR